MKDVLKINGQEICLRVLSEMCLEPVYFLLFLLLLKDNEALKFKENINQQVCQAIAKLSQRAIVLNQHQKF